jgi:hypothetical protein
MRKQDGLFGMTFRARLVLLGGAMTLAPLAAIVLVVWHQNTSTLAATVQGCDSLAESDLLHLSQSFYNLCDASNSQLQKHVRTDLGAAKHLLDRDGGFHLSPTETVSWQARNQESGATVSASLPRGYLGSAESIDKFVADVKAATGANCTLFQKLNSAGDMLRIATTVTTADGKPATGTFIARANADGSANRVISTVEKGETFIGRARVADAFSVTAYTPLHDSAGALIGMLFVGIPESEATDRIRKLMIDTRIAQSGYIYVLNSKGPMRGHYLVSQGGKRDGENILETKSHDGRSIIHEIVGIAPTLHDGRFARIHYPWRNASDSSARERTVILRYFEPWDWVIGVTVPVDEFRGTAVHLQSLASKGTRQILAVIGIALLLALFIWLFVASSMTRRLREAVLQLREGATQVLSASGMVAEASQHLAHSANRQSGDTQDVCHSLIDFSSRTEHGAAQAAALRDAAAETKSSAIQGASSTIELGSAMTEIETSGRSVSKVLDVINEIALQTNLLALNAAVEAARAGAAGRGFAVVADGVRSLASRCSEAAGETAELISNAMAAGRRGSTLATQTTESLRDIENRSTRLDQIAVVLAEDSNAQAVILKQVNSAIARIATSSQESLTSTEETASAAEQLSAQANTLQDVSLDLEEILLGRRRPTPDLTR